MLCGERGDGRCGDLCGLVPALTTCNADTLVGATSVDVLIRRDWLEISAKGLNSGAGADGGTDSVRMCGGWMGSALGSVEEAVWGLRLGLRGGAGSD